MALAFYHPLLARDVLLGSGVSTRRQLASPSRKTTLSLDIEEHVEAYHMSADLPGIGEEDVQLKVHRGMLTIDAEKKVEVETEDEDGKPVKLSRTTRSFKRTFKLPDDVDEQGISATMEKGVLFLKLPKKPEDAPRRIVVGSVKSQLNPAA
jgi:HSP20 family protein